MAEYRKKLIEVALPLKEINEQSAREKSIRHGHPSTLHLWWARRPLAACRAVLFAQLVDDPSSDPAYRRPDGSVDEDRAGIKRAELFNLIEELVRWENSNNPDVINRARAEIARCVASRKIELGELKKETIIYGREEGKEHPDGPIPNKGLTAYEMVLMRCEPKVVNHFLAKYAPPVLDPFAGGGSIPLEAQRLGLRAYASDLNPVAVLINKALIEIPPKFAGMPPINPEWQKKSPEAKILQSSWQGAKGLAEDVRYYGKWMRDEAEKRIGHFYPKVKITKEMTKDRPDLQSYIGRELPLVAYLWARTVPSPDPALKGAPTPLFRSRILRKKARQVTWLEVEPTKNGRVTFHVRVGKKAPAVASSGTISRSGARCIFSDTTIPFSYLRECGKAGTMDEVPIALIVASGRQKFFVDADAIVRPPAPDPPSDLFDTRLPEKALGFRVQAYGMTTHRSLFSPYQLLALSCFSDLIQSVRDRVKQDAEHARHKLDPEQYADAVAVYLAFAVDRCADYWSYFAIWSGDFIAHTFGRNALSMIWDYAEANPFSGATGGWDGAVDWICRVIAELPADGFGYVEQRDARRITDINERIIVCTDPPYYDNVGYADLSDFFYVWLRQSLKHIRPGAVATLLTPKTEELIADPGRHADAESAKNYFESGFREVALGLASRQTSDVPAAIFYAFKQTEAGDGGIASTGWETFLSGVLDAGFSIVGTWPVRTERPGRLRETGSNALATSVVLACVPRSPDAPLATRREFITALKQELAEALRLLQSGSIAPVDMAQAAIGPGMAIFSRYAKVVESDGSPMTVRTALTLINQVLDEVLAEQEGEFDSDTRWAVAWFEQFGMEEGPFGVAETLSKAKNTSVQGLVEAGVVASQGGKVKLLGREELPDDWDPATDARLTEWEAVQHLIRALDRQGETGAADLLRKLGSDYGERARDLAYRLYAICERKGWSGEALAYNSLVIAWPEISKLAHQTLAGTGEQRTLFE